MPIYHYYKEDGEYHSTEENQQSNDYFEKCPECGSPTINCTVADGVCTNEHCGYVGTKYSGTIYG